MSVPLAPGSPHLVSVVVPVYQGERHLPALVAEIEALTVESTTPAGARFRVAEVLLVHDCGPDDSARVIRELEAAHPAVRGLWLSRNFGQHAATLAGMASTAHEWIVTMDEDGQHDPRYIGALLDAALEHRASLVYARPTNEAPHGGLRNAASHTAKRLVEQLAGTPGASQFHSYRLVLGEVGRSLAAYAGAGVYLDVALGWIAGRAVTAPVVLRDEGERRSGYSLRTLMSHFWRMVITGGTRALRLVSVVGVAFAVLGFLVAVVLTIFRLTGADVIQGWTSLIVLVLVSTGAILFSLGVIAEYVGVSVGMAMGKPLYLLVSDPATGPLGRAKGGLDRLDRRGDELDRRGDELDRRDGELREAPAEE